MHVFPSRPPRFCHAVATMLGWSVTAITAQQHTVEDLFAADWRKRNQAALALRSGDLDAAALLAAIARRETPWLPDPETAMVGLGGGLGLDAVQAFARSHVQAVVARPQLEWLPEPLRRAGDLMVPWDPRALALWVAVERGLPGAEIATAAEPLLAAADDRQRIAAASALWRVGDGGASIRQRVLAEPEGAGLLAAAVADAPLAAAAELDQAMRRGDEAVRRAICRWLPEDVAQRHEALRTVLVEGCFLAADETAAIAGWKLQAMGASVTPALAAALVDRTRAARAAGLLLALGEDAAAATAELVALLQDPAAEETARLRAALALGVAGPRLERTAPELARTAAAALLERLQDRRTRGGFGTAVVYALRGYPTARGAAAEQALLTLRQAWMPRVSHAELAATHALLGDPRGSGMSVSELEKTLFAQRRFGLAGPCADALAQRSAEAEAEAALRAFVMAGYSLRLGEPALRAAAPVLRGWLEAEPRELQRAAVLQLARLGAAAGVAPERIAAFAAADAGDVVRDVAKVWLAQCVPPAARDEALEQLCELSPTAGIVGTLARLALPSARREELLARVLAGADRWCWQVAELDVATVRAVARRILSGGPSAAARAAALDALARVGPEAGDEAVLLAALATSSDPELLYALSAGPSLPPAVAELLTARIGPDTDPTWLWAAVRCLWQHRAR